HRIITDRGHLLARRSGAPGLRGGDQPRLSDHVRHAVRLHTDRAFAEINQRSHLYADRSTNRFRRSPNLTARRSFAERDPGPRVFARALPQRLRQSRMSRLLRSQPLSWTRPMVLSRGYLSTTRFFRPDD